MADCTCDRPYASSKKANECKVCGGHFCPSCQGRCQVVPFIMNAIKEPKNEKENRQ